MRIIIIVRYCKSDRKTQTTLATLSNLNRQRDTVHIFVVLSIQQWLVGAYLILATNHSISQSIWRYCGCLHYLGSTRLRLHKFIYTFDERSPHFESCVFVCRVLALGFGVRHLVEDITLLPHVLCQQPLICPITHIIRALHTNNRW